MKRIKKLTIGLIISLVLISGCTGPRTKTINYKFDNVSRLIQIEDAESAKQHAPKFTEEALKTIVELEYILESSQ